jgi:hypothetical protein
MTTVIIRRIKEETKAWSLARAKFLSTVISRE